MSTKKDTSSETLYGALVKLRGVLSNPEKKSINPHFKSKYCKLEDLIQHVREPLSSHGLTFVQNIVNEEKSVMAQTTIIHESGQTLTLDGPAVLIDKFTPQGVGAACTYAKRYGICSAFGIESDDDDDANSVEDQFKDKDKTKPPAKKAPAKKVTPIAEAKKEPVSDTIADEGEAVEVVRAMKSTVDTFASGTENDLILFWKENKQVIDMLDSEYPDQYQELKLYFSQMRKHLKEGSYEQVPQE
tara:strand:+ start:159 stop:890 length:732 start_codon:yes stop_codon:yes gene_type:complete